ncbi:MAG: DUF3189 family protein [Syntrophomonadaceae bacterium]|jgi:hypothetical protein|nr:DUF3189 family protein [Syntrophomonadaceae bacterium]
MEIIYHCFGGSHSSVTAAAIHLEMLPTHRIPTREELMALPYFDKTTDNDFGLIKLMGVDGYGNRVYVLGKRSLGDRFSRVLKGVAELMGVERELLVVNTMIYVNWVMMLGGYVSRRIGLPMFGRPVVCYGTRKAFLDLVGLVKTVKVKAAH